MDCVDGPHPVGPDAARHGRSRASRALPASTRTLRFADGSDEVHRNAIAKVQLARYADQP
jgi:hypothetical protein